MDDVAGLDVDDPAGLHADLIVSTRKSIRTALKQFFFISPILIRSEIQRRRAFGVLQSREGAMASSGTRQKYLAEGRQ